MKSTLPPSPPPAPVDDAATGLPGFRTWAGVYWFVFGSFVALVIALAVFARIFA